MMNQFKSILLAGLLMGSPACMQGQTSVPTAQASENSSKPRVIITCDPELDDLNSMIRFLLFSTDYQVEGLIYASSQFHWKGDGQGTKFYMPNREYSRNGIDFGPMESYRWDPNERFIDDVVAAYKEAYPNLKKHDPSYPTPAYLKSKIRVGNVEFEGDFSKDTPGSELIKAVILDEGTEPVYINAWGGCSTIARALKSIEEIYGQTEGWKVMREKIVRKVILSLSGDQDETYASYIRPFWSEIRQEDWLTGVGGMGYLSQMGAAAEDAVYYSAAWTQENIRSKGPLGNLYRVWGDGKQMAKGDKFDFFGLSGNYTAEELRQLGYIVWAPIQEAGSFLSEGDTPCFLNMIDNGLRAHEDLSYGGWSQGLRILPDSLKERQSLPDFIPAIMNGLAARIKWSVTSRYKDANHAPVIEGDLAMKGKAGETLKLKYKVTDPDKDALTVNWWQYVSAGSYEGRVSVDDPTQAVTTFTIPQDAKSGDTIHLILEATDNGAPSLNHYLRLIITVV